MHKEINQLLEELDKIIIGKRDVLKLLLIGILGDGHLLIEDIPGVGKTEMIKSVSGMLGIDYGRLQGTPDILPSDIVGFNMFNPSTRAFEYRKGVWDTQLLLVDEINRMTPMTQSSLLEIMEEKQVTVDGTQYKMPKPFIVVATQNPYESVGTYELPDAQMDRFLMRINMGYPSSEGTLAILMNVVNQSLRGEVKASFTTEDIVKMQEEVKEVRVDEVLLKKIVEVVEKTRNHAQVRVGVSTRGIISFVKGIQACAYVAGRNYAVPDDLKAVASAVLAHRLVMRHESGRLGQEEVILSILKDCDLC